MFIIVGGNPSLILRSTFAQPSLRRILNFEFVGQVGLVRRVGLVREKNFEFVGQIGLVRRVGLVGGIGGLMEWEVKFANSKIKLYFCSIKTFTKKTKD